MIAAVEQLNRSLKLHIDDDAVETGLRAAAFGLCGEIADTAADALAKARQLASENDMIFVGGSLYLAAEVC